MSAILLSIVTFVTTLVGGLFALSFRKKLHLIMGFTAGVLLGVVTFDIFPEIVEMANNGAVSVRAVMVALVIGFLLFHIVEKSIVVHYSHESEYASHTHPNVGILSALALAGHSFMDGVGIGLGFQVSPALGLVVALAVVAHDFSDGINTVALMLTHHNTVAKSKKFLLVDALAPILGAVSTLFFQPSEGVLALYLGFFAGFLLYIGTSDILPEAHSENSSLLTVLLTVLGAAFIFAITHVI